jgi:hypothetical protein
MFLGLGLLAVQVCANAETKQTAGVSCATLGQQYGRCASLVMIGKTCPAKDDFVMPARCHGSKETEAGIKRGIAEVAPNGFVQRDGQLVPR